MIFVLGFRNFFSSGIIVGSRLIGFFYKPFSKSADVSSQLLEVVSSSDSESSSPENTSTPQKSIKRSLPVQKWNIKFTGDSKDWSLNNFLERVDELRVARNVTEQELYNSSIDLFDGKALLWYRSNKHRFSNWSSLSELLRKHYEPPDYKPRLFQEIMNRTQDVNERFVDYFACMTSLFRRYGHVPEDIQLGIVARNLAPFYTMQLPPVHSLLELEEECLILETKRYRTENYVPPCSSTAILGNPPTSSRPVSINQITCWNCNNPGHRALQCKQPV